MATIRYETSISCDPSNNGNISKYSRLEDVFVCSVCFDLYDVTKPLKLPKTLPCLHSFCEACLERHNNSCCEKNERFHCELCPNSVPVDLKTISVNNDLIKLIEARNKSPWSYNYHAACPSCLKIRTLEACFECLQPVCENCSLNHFGSWKEKVNKQINNHERELSEYLTNLESLQPSVDNNIKNLNKIEQEIDFRYQNLIKELNKEREKLFLSLNELKAENEIYGKCKQSLKQTILNLKKTESENKKYEKSEMKSRKDKINLLDKEFEEVQKFFVDLTRKPLNLVNQNLVMKNTLLGELELQEVEIPHKKTTISSQPITPVSILRNQFSNNRLFSDLSTLQTTKNDSKNENKIINYDEILKKYIKSSQAEPDWEISLDHAPSHITNYNNLVFICDDFGELSIFESQSDVIFNKKSKQKLNFTNIRNISVNSKYFGITFSLLSKEDIKRYNRKLPTSGICLFRRNENMVCSDMDSFIKLPSSSKTGGFLSPKGLILQEEYIYVSDRELAKVYKINFHGDIIQKFKIDGKVYDISINSLFLIITDYKAHELNLVDVNRMSLVKRVPVDQVNKFDNGPFNVELTKENLIFFINASNTDVYLYDINLNYKTSFSIKFSKILNLSVLDSLNHSLLIGSKTNNHKYKLSCFIPK